MLNCNKHALEANSKSATFLKKELLSFHQLASMYGAKKTYILLPEQGTLSQKESTAARFENVRKPDWRPNFIICQNKQMKIFLQAKLQINMT